MPWDVIQRKGSWIVVDKSGKTYGTHPTKHKARQQQKALYAAEGRRRQR